MASSSSSSPERKEEEGDDDSETTTRSAGKRPRPPSDSDDNDDSGPRSGGRGRYRRLESDSSSSSSSSSSDGNGESDKCPICLLRLSTRDVGTPDACAHVFCADCLLEWADHVNTCPVDRKEFSAVLVRPRVGAQVERTVPVKPRRASFDELLEEQPTVCQICHSADSEETMLLCDTCDLGYHMECLTPPLQQVPPGDWHCAVCAPNSVNAHSVDGDEPHPSSSRRPLRTSSSRIEQVQVVLGTVADEAPSTSSQGSSRGEISSRTGRHVASRHGSRLRLATKKTRRKRRRARRTVVVEYDIRDGEKFPSKKKYVLKRRRKKAKRRTPRTVARRSLVRSSVRGRLAELFRTTPDVNLPDGWSHAGAPRLSLFGDRNELDVYVSDEDIDEAHSGGGAATVAVAPRSHASAILQAYRHTRRKQIMISSPTYASSAPDLLSSIMESQSLLHSKNSSISLTQDGTIVLKPLKPTNGTNANDCPNGAKSENIDVSNAGKEKVKETPAYGSGGSGRGGGGNWRGNRNDYQNDGNRNNRSYHGGSYQNNQNNYWESNNYNNNENYDQSGSFFNSNNSWSNNRMQNRDHFPNYQERSPQMRNQNRGRGQQRFSAQPLQRSRSIPIWQQNSYSDSSQSFSEQTTSSSYPERVSLEPNNEQCDELVSIPNTERIENKSDNSQLGVYQVSDQSSHSMGNMPPQPPIIRFNKPDLSEDEKSEPDTATTADKYDPTEPTLDDSTDDESAMPLNIQPQLKIVSPTKLRDSPEPESFTTDTVNVVDDAVQQVLQDHENLLSACSADSESKDDDDAGCPNFSIYSSTSMDIAKGKKEIVENKLQHDEAPEDLVQEDDVESENDDTNVSSTNVCIPASENVNLIINDVKEPSVSESIPKVTLNTPNKNVPKRNIIKINLSSNMGITKRLLDNENEEMDRLMTGSNLNLDLNNENIDERIHVPNSPADRDTELISDNEDDRSYTPCLDENKSVKSKDTSIEDNDRGNSGLDGLDTELISDDEGNELFSDTNHRNDFDGTIERPIRNLGAHIGDHEEGEIIEKNKQKIKAIVKELLEKPEDSVSDEERRKRRKDKKISERDDKDKTYKSRNKRDDEDDFAFKKLSKSGKERNYRERDDKGKRNKRRSKSTDKENRDRKDKVKKKEKRKDMERYDVRNIISDKNRRIKDAFGRDKSRPKSNTPSPRHMSPARFRRSLSRRHSLPRRPSSRGHRSPSRRHSNSPALSRNGRSPSPHKAANRRSPVARKRTISRGIRSLSRENRSPSKKLRRSISPRIRRTPSPRKRSVSPKARSPLIRSRRSISPKLRRSKSPRTRRSISRGRNKRKRSTSHSRRVSPRALRNLKPSPRRRQSRRSRSRLRSISRNRSKSPKLKKSRRPKTNSNSNIRRSKSPIKTKSKRKRSRSFSPTLALSRSLSRDRVRQQQWQETGKSPLFQEWTSGSRSISPRGMASPGWTPPMDKSPEPRNLRVILTTKEKIKKKDKKKKGNKRNKASDRVLKHQSKDSGPSKEVFTSGNNILVSVSFNKNKESDKISTHKQPELTTKKKKRKDGTNKQKKDKNKEKVRKKRVDREKRTKELENKKPVAIIDLDKSPFKELTPSPKAVIVLSDSDSAEKNEPIRVQEKIHTKMPEVVIPPPEIQSFPNSPDQNTNYIALAGPKTPPEPSIKFTILSKNNPQLRSTNPLHEDEEDEPDENAETTQTEETQNKIIESTHKGPNTPPEPPNSPPSSPDAYDPFEPTKSGSATPEKVPTPPMPIPPPQIENEKLIERIDEVSQIPCISLETAQKSNIVLDDVIQSKPISPTEKVMALLKSTRASLSPGNSMTQIFSDQIFDNSKIVDLEVHSATNNVSLANSSPERKAAQTQISFSAIIKPSSPKPIYSTVTPTIITSTSTYLNPSVPRIGIYNMGTSPSALRNTTTLTTKINLPSPTKSSPLKTQPPKLFASKPSPIKSTPIKPMLSKTPITKLPLPTIKPLLTRKPIKKPGQNGNEITNIDMDMDSPYSPGSSDFGDLFDPPADNGKHNAIMPSVYPQKPSNKFDAFESLLALKPTKNVNKTSNAAKMSGKHQKKSKGKTIVGVKMDEDSLKILDDLPSSAVEMQVKTKFLKKLNRQERVVEEVKLVLKPHYNKKHINKEDYKEILRRAVPKICHNRSGEINPAKIQALIEAYVRKFRKKAHTAK